MNNKSHSLQKQKLKRTRHFYSIIEEPCTSDSQEGEELSKLLRKGNQFLYIDINEQKGFKLMEPCKEKLVQEESLHFGENYVTNLQNLSTISSKAVSLLLQLKDDSNKKEKSSFLMAEEIKKKREKLRQIGRIIVRKEKPDNTIVKPMVYKGMPNELIENLMWSRQNEQMQNQIKKRQSVLLQHYSTITSGDSQNQAKLGQLQKSRKSKEHSLDLKHYNSKR